MRGRRSAGARVHVRTDGRAVGASGGLDRSAASWTRTRRGRRGRQQQGWARLRAQGHTLALKRWMKRMSGWL